MKYLFLLAAILLASPAAANPLRMWVAMGGGTITHSFESGLDGWTLGSSMSRITSSGYDGTASISQTTTGTPPASQATRTITTGAGEFKFYYDGINTGATVVIDGTDTINLSPGSWSSYTRTLTAGEHTFVINAVYGDKYDFFTYPAP